MRQQSLFKKQNNSTKMKNIIYLGIALVLAAILFYIRFFVSPNSWLSNWGSYLFVVPLLYFLFSAITRWEINLKFIAILTIGVTLPILMVRGNWSENYVLLKIIATFSGTLFSCLIYFWTHNRIR